MRIIVIAFIVLISASCLRRSAADAIQLAPTPPLSRTIIGYGVIDASYTHVLDRRDESGEPLGLLRKGSIVEILERRPVVKDGKAESWVFTMGTYAGWLREDKLKVYDSRAQAETAAGSSNL